ncbi:hypothetical protein KF840_25100 [bacterium]|nr:hypothetical protein [bacterium]
MMVPSNALAHAVRMGRRVAGLALVTALLGAPHAAAAPALSCCICDACPLPQVTQCFEAPMSGCQAQCAALDCASFSETALSCGNQPQCPTFSAPAPAPALTPVGLGLTLIVLAALGRRAVRRRG